jgi:hypothetical protein
MDGFDAGDYSLKYNYSTNAGFSSSATTRFSSGRSLYKAYNNGGMLYKSIPASASVIIGFAANYNTNYATYPAVFAGIAGDNGATGHIHIGTGDTAGTIEVSRGFYTSRTVLFTTPVPVNTWNYYELRVKVHDTTGYADLKINGATVGTFSGDTKNGGTSTNIDNIILFGSGNNTSINVYWDDFYVIDETGSAPYNTYLGDVRVQTLTPSAAGNSTQFTPSSGANYTTVDELPYSTTDYVQAGTPGNTDLYTLSDATNSNVIYGVQNNVIAKKTDAGTISVRPVIRSGGTNYNGASKFLGTDDTVVSDTRELDPNTSAAWTQSNVNALEAGFEVV